MINKNYIKSLFILLIYLAGIFAGAESLPKNLLDSAYLNIHDNPDKSLEIAQKLYKSSDEPRNRITTFLIMAQAYSSKVNYQKSFEYAFAAQKIAEESNDYSNQILIMCFISRQYYHLRITEKSWEFIRKAEDLMQKHKIPKEFEHIKGSYYLQKGYLLQSDLNCENAIHYFEKAIEFYKHQPSDNEIAQINLAFSYGHKAHCLIETGNYERAEMYLEELSSMSYKLKNKGLEIFAKIGIAKIHHFQKEFTQSNQVLLPLLSVIGNVDYKELSIEIYKLLAENYLSLDEIQQHNYYSNLFKQENLSYKQSGINSVNSLIQLEETKNSNDQNIIYIIFIVLMIIICVILYWKIFRTYSIYKKLKRDLKYFKNTS